VITLGHALTNNNNNNLCQMHFRFAKMIGEIDLLSNSPAFKEQLLRCHFLPKKLQSKTVSK